MTSETIRRAFDTYSTKFDARVGPIGAGQYGQFERTLVKRFDLQEFETTWAAFKELETAYRRILEAGDTVTNALYDEVRERAAQLLLEESSGSFWW